MSPNSVNTTVNLMTNSHDAMTKREDGVICVKTDVASASPDKQPDTAISLEKEIMAEETGAKSGASGDEPAVANDDGNMGLVDGSPPAAAADAAAPSNGADDKTPDLLVVPKAVGGAVGEGSIDPLQPQRRASNEERVKLKSSHLRDSSTSVDSWGGKGGSIPPLRDEHEKEVIVPGLENDIGNFISSTHGSPLSPQDRSAAQGSDDGDDLDDPTNYINFNKLLEPSSSEYYYSQKNRNNREILNKIMTKKQIAHGSLLDDSHHSRISMLSQLSHASSYRGPLPLKKDGSSVKSIFKSARHHSSNSADCISGGSSVPEDTNELKAKPMKRCAFSCVDIREHERIAGDNPCVTSGVPLSIGWRYNQHDSISLDDYEFHKGPSRDKIEMMVPATIRRQMLRDEFGVSITDMNAAMKEVNITKRQRKTSVATEHLEGWAEVTQSAKRKFKRFMKKTSTAKDQEKLWASAHKIAMSEYLKTHGESSLGKNPEGVGMGKINQGPKISPETDQGVPPLEISFQSSEDIKAPSY